MYFIISLIIRIFYGNLAQADDTFSIKLRKIVLAVAFVCSFGVLLCAFYLTFVQGVSSASALTFNICEYVVALTLIGCWTVCRITKEADDTLMDVLLGIFQTTVIVALLTAPGFPFPGGIHRICSGYHHDGYQTQEASSIPCPGRIPNDHLRRHLGEKGSHPILPAP